MSEKFHNSGLQRGDYLAIVSENRLEYVLLLRTCLELGIIPVPINPQLPSQQRYHLLNQIGCRYVVLNTKGGDWTVGELGSWGVGELGSWGVGGGDYLDLGTIPHEQIATVVFTSGSSGEPKAVVHTWGNHYFSALGANENIPFGLGDRWLLSLPLYHVGGLAILFRAWISGGEVVIPSHTLLEAIESQRITHLSLVATQLYRLLEYPAAIRALRNMKAILLGGSAMPLSLLQQAVKYDLPIYTSYGSTEMASQITTTAPGDPPWTSGKVLKYREVQISEDGEIQVRGRTLFKGYLKAGKIEYPHTNSWFSTSDQGYLDKNKNLIVTGRKDNMFISGGENIQPEEIEQILNHCKNVRQAIVVPIEHLEFGFRPVAFVDGADSDTSRLQQELAKYLPGFKIPDYFFPWPDLEPGLKWDRCYFKQLAENMVS